MIVIQGGGEDGTCKKGDNKSADKYFKNTESAL